MTGSLPWPLPPATHWPDRSPEEYRRTSSGPSLAIALILLLMLVSVVMATIFFAEGNSVVCMAFVVAGAVLAFGLLYLVLTSRR